jgi:hypothetical protein
MSAVNDRDDVWLLKRRLLPAQNDLPEIRPRNPTWHGKLLVDV